MVDLHAACLGGAAYDLAGLRIAAQAFFDGTSDPHKHNGYFGNFTGLWRQRLEAGRFQEAEAIWQLALNPALAWETQHRDLRIHKGTPFYWWGMTAILAGNLNKGYALMHQALEEDKRSFPDEYTRHPPFAFASMDYPKVEQAFRVWLLRQAEFLEGLIGEYNRMNSRSFDLEQFRKRFLKSTPTLDSVFLFSHAISHFLAIDNIPEYARKSPFAGQMEMNLLFDVLLVVDRAIREKNPMKSGFPTFLDQAEFLAQKAQLRLTRDKLREVNAVGKTDVGRKLTQILNREFTFSDGSTLGGAEIDVCVAYALRNYGAHNVEPLEEVWQRFGDVRQRCLNTLFLTVESLY